MVNSESGGRWCGDGGHLVITEMRVVRMVIVGVGLLLLIISAFAAVNLVRVFHGKV